MRLAFAGTPEFARVGLERLHAAGHEIALVLCQPDRPAGRGMKTEAAPVKAYALAHGFAVAQPRGLRLDGRFADDAAAARAALLAAAPEAIVVAAYGLILPTWLLELPRLGCINIHASLLPRWRGAAPIQRAIESGDNETGVTLMQMDAGLDTGAILLVATTPISASDTSATLLARLAAIGGELAVRGLADAAAGRLQPRPQPELGVTYAAKIAKSQAAIDWREPAAVIERRLRAFDPFPGARGTVGGETITCWRGGVRAASPGSPAVPGEIVAAGGGAITVACGDGWLDLVELQRPGGRRMPAAEFLRGRAPAAGARFELPDAPGDAAI
ncbi:MAG: methionyl-tRNA formyltransferase [Burkholderiales bacterium]|nr:methionyl-tRNA formyltransferase [Burkholderiales bacterium]